MAGQFLNKMISGQQISEMMIIILDWQKTVFNSENSWEANNLHVDEISPLFENRNVWVEAGLACFKLLLQNKMNKTNSKLIPFLHIDLQNSDADSLLLELNEAKLKSEIDKLTPPSLMYIEKKYLENEILQQLKFCEIDKSDVLLNEYKYNIYFRLWYDSSDETYSRELYVFADPALLRMLNK